MATDKAPETNADFKSDGLEVVDLLQRARAKALGGQAGAGRGPEGRRWAVIITELEKQIALVRYYNGLGLGSTP